MKIADWLFKKLIEARDELKDAQCNANVYRDTAEKYREQVQYLTHTVAQFEAELEDARAERDDARAERNDALSGNARIQELEARIAAMAPQKQFRVFRALGNDAGGHQVSSPMEVLSVASYNGFTDITVASP